MNSSSSAGIICPSFATRYVRPCRVVIPWFKLPGLSIWCMAHNCYDCSCGHRDLPSPQPASEDEEDHIQDIHLQPDDSPPMAQYHRIQQPDEMTDALHCGEVADTSTKEELSVGSMPPSSVYSFAPSYSAAQTRSHMSNVFSQKTTSINCEQTCHTSSPNPSEDTDQPLDFGMAAQFCNGREEISTTK